MPPTNTTVHARRATHRPTTVAGFRSNAPVCQALAWRSLFDKLLAAPATPTPSRAPIAPRPDRQEAA